MRSKEAEALKHEKRALAIAKEELKDMRLRGTSYRQETARYVVLFFTDLVTTRTPFDFSQEELKRVLRQKYALDSDRVDDVAKSIEVVLSKAKDEDRLAEYYAKAEEIIKKKDVDRKS